MDLDRKYFVIMGTTFPDVFPGLVPRKRAEAENELEQCSNFDGLVYLVEIVREGGRKKINNYGCEK